MAVKAKLTEKERRMVRLFKNPVLFGEFLHEIDTDVDFGVSSDEEDEQTMEFTKYQKEFLSDTNSFISMRAGRTVGKTFAIVHYFLWILFNNLYPGEYVVYSVPNKSQLDPVWELLKTFFRINSLMKNFVNYRSGINNSEHRIETTTGSTLLCRIAGQSGKGENVIGLHTPFFIVDECVVGTQKIAGKNTNKRISELKIGDTVLSWDGKNIVEDRVSNIKKIERKQKVLEIQFNNTYIRVGENHRVYTNKGYKKANELSVGNNIYYFKNTRRKYWEPNEVSYVKEQIQKAVPVKDIAKKLNRSVQSVFRKIQSLGLSVREVFDIVDLSEQEYQIILGSFLGDGSAEIELERARYRTNHSLKQKEYVDWLRKKLDRLVRAEPAILNNGGWGTLNYSLHTLGHPKILEIAKELYINNTKTITREYLNKLDSLGLAVWWMDDGSESGMFSTHSFSKEENEIIVNYLKEKWGINSKIYKDKRKDLYFIKIITDSLDKFRKIIEPHIPECMKYKIGKGNYNNEVTKISIVSSEEDSSTLEKYTIKNIKEVNTRAKYLYDITVENNHNFFVNGVLTKNSGYYPWGTWLELQATINYWMPGSKLIVSGVPTGIREENVNFHVDKEDKSYSRYRISAYQNPRFDEAAEKDAIRRYGGKDTEEFAHFVLGKHGSPVYAVFDRRLMNIESYKVFKIDINGISFGETWKDYRQKVEILPHIPRNNGVMFGIDLGYTEPTAIFVMYIDKDTENIKFHAKIRLVKVPYPIQKRFIDALDSKYSPNLIGVDEGHSGMSVTQDLLKGKQFSNKRYEDYLIPIKFNSSIVLGTDEDGKEIKSRAKPLSVSILQEYVNKHIITFSVKDMETVSELERMTYKKNPSSGLISYRTLTPAGGKRGADHFTAALLSGILAYYLKNEKLDFRSRGAKLLGTGWL